jgi:hypothetical protein
MKIILSGVLSIKSTYANVNLYQKQQGKQHNLS